MKEGLDEMHALPHISVVCASLGACVKSVAVFLLVRGDRASWMDGLHTSGTTFCIYAWNGNVGAEYEFVSMLDRVLNLILSVMLSWAGQVSDITGRSAEVMSYAVQIRVQSMPGMIMNIVLVAGSIGVANQLQVICCITCRY
jgi:hypothetical protein